MSQTTIVGSGISRIHELLGEIELYITVDDNFLQPDNYGSVERRVKIIQSEAEAIKAADLVTISRALVEFLSEYVAQNKPLKFKAQRARGALAALQHLARLQLLRLDGTYFPDNLQNFVGMYVDRTHRCLQGQEPCLCDRNNGSGFQKCLRILVADDEELVRHLITDTFVNSCHLVMSVKNGSDAIAAIDSGLFELVFTDLNMPGAGGIEVLRHAKSRFPHTEVVIATGFASVENAVDSTRYGAYDYITKPFTSPSTILAVAERAGEHIALSERNRRLLREEQRRNAELKRYASSLEDALDTVAEKQKALMHADRMSTLGVLSAGVAHEINNPTTFIRGNLQTLEKFWDSVLLPELGRCDVSGNPRLKLVLDEMPALIQDMITGTQRIAKIVSALRTFSHHNQSYQRLPTDITHCIGSALELTHNRLKNCVEVTRDIAEGLPEIAADPQQMTQVFVNLVLNAADAIGEAKGGHITVSARQEGGCLVVTVEDNGCGIEEKIKGKIFDPFFTTKAPGKGTGLGLSIITGILRDHDGEVQAENLPKGGARFTVRLPLTPDARKRSSGSPLVLVIDDNRDAVQMLESTLKTVGGYTVISSESARVALELIERTPPAAIIMDVMMPEMDGFELLQEIRKIGGKAADSCIVCVTALDTRNVETKLYTLGADYVLFKPFKIRDVAECLEKGIAKRAKAGAHSQKS